MSRHTYGDVGYSGVDGGRHREDDEGYASDADALFEARREANRQRGIELIAQARAEAKRLADAKEVKS